MVAFSFGSFGDIIALVELASKLHDAINSAGSIAKELEDSKKELHSFLYICNSIEKSVENGVTIHQDDLVMFKVLTDNCRECLQNFEKYLARFDDSRQLVRLARRAQLSMSKKEEINQFQSRMRGFVAALGIIQTRYCSREITAQISRSLDEPWDQKPMKFQDALGRRYPVPLEVCGTFKGFMNFLQFAFKSNPILHAAVQQCQIWLFTPANSNPGLWYIVLKDDWKHISKPGVRLGMSFATQPEEQSGACQDPWRGVSATAQTDAFQASPTANVNSLGGRLMLDEDTIKGVKFEALHHLGNAYQSQSAPSLARFRLLDAPSKATGTHRTPSPPSPKTKTKPKPKPWDLSGCVCPRIRIPFVTAGSNDPQNIHIHDLVCLN
ncbi:uncharacterized protein F5Z01DRAFT_687413 [Emericellopsis atlantica]|uniref:Ubiquitin-like domain-containing protein n=1 Tax=Emericellopsis atlantica TaxID=2614577 RepID=A0A9P8CNY4_9HYPO|nr:uncharacterized protein F5Z01DRAFT_687413 [Emericellopsis atlantica]KAG9253978.1 hypothetical protein F5Z01DRAFT_687413 [Emericellopsis atlantica]